MKTSAFFAVALLLMSGCSKDPDGTSTNREFAIYLSIDTLIRGNIDIEAMPVEEEPFITFDEIVYYDSAKHILKLSFSVDSIFNYDQNMTLRGFLASIDTSVIFYGIFYSPVNSAPNPNIVITLPCDNSSEPNRLEIIEGYPNTDYYKGYQSVNDERFIKLLQESNKLQ